MKLTFRQFVRTLLGVSALLLMKPATAQLTSLYSFTGGSDGKNPTSKLVKKNGVLYGTAIVGGANGAGVVFRMNTNGTGFAVLHDFYSASDHLAFQPYGNLVIKGKTLYGTTLFGGANNGAGVVFKINTDGTGFAVLHDFQSASDNAAFPIGGLFLSGTTLYGTSASGGTNDKGTVFKIKTDGTGFAVIHSFSGGDGAGLAAPVIVKGTTIYGTASNGGANGGGVVFRMKTDGTGFAVLHDFNSASDHLAINPAGAPTLKGTTLYGVVQYGGAHNGGVVFRVSTSGTGFSILHDFDAGSDGGYPYCGLTLKGNTLYGATPNVGTISNGTLFKIGTDGTGYAVLHNFNGTDGNGPFGALLRVGSTLYGTTAAGGASDDGTVFSFVP